MTITAAPSPLPPRAAVTVAVAVAVAERILHRVAAGRGARVALPGGRA